MGRLHLQTRRAAASALAVGLGLSLGSVAHAGGSSGSSGGCGCVPTSHQVKVPGIQITAPTVTVSLPMLNVEGGWGGGNGTSTATADSSANANAGVSVNINSTTSNVTNAQAQANTVYGGGGGGGFSDSGSVTTSIESVRVEQPTPPETRRICAAFRAAAKMVAIQASCLDDKDIPHAASQLGPGRDVVEGYEGELYRCIAGARMQYIIAEYGGQANFDHGQTFTCQKGEALYHTAAGAVQCRAQKPARDCNERSLLRRFGAGIKVLKVAGENVCVAWRTETVEAAAASY